MSDYIFSSEASMKLRQFLNKKMDVFRRFNSEKSDWKEVEKELESGFFQGYKTKSGSTFRGDGYWLIYLNDDCYTKFTIYKKGRYSFYLNFFEISSNGWYCSENFLRKAVQEMPKIAAEFEALKGELEILKGELEKQEKIVEMSQKSIHAYLAVTMQNSGYEYYTTNDEHKVLLSVKMKRGVQLDIPIYFLKFQTIMPKLIETIKNYEKTIHDNKVKVLISNLKKEVKWQQ